MMSGVLVRPYQQSVLPPWLQGCSGWHYLLHSTLEARGQYQHCVPVLMPLDSSELQFLICTTEMMRVPTSQHG